jgi:cytochrome oxidase Cu insertion factor (SCO1/SenC/PrrC family)
MMESRRLAWGLVLVLGACRPAAAGSVAGAASAETPNADAERKASNREPGELLEETVPLLSGEALDLASLRGRVVVLELSATWVETWERAHEDYEKMLAQIGDDDLVVVVVSLDAERDKLGSEWERNSHPFLLGWDPQGALAARLQVADLPTVFVVGRDGRIAHVLSGSGLSDRSGIAEHVRTTVASR